LTDFASCVRIKPKSIDASPRRLCGTRNRVRRPASRSL
jgi:hypothetical protein